MSKSTHDAKVEILKARFPTLRISSGYIGNVYGIPGTPAYRDDRDYMIVTGLTHDDGRTASIALDSPNADFDVEEVSLTLQNWLVHSNRSHAGRLASCPCFGCQYKRSRKQWEEDSSRRATRDLELTSARLKTLARDWEHIAGEPVRIEHVMGAIYGVCSELGARRLAMKYNSKRARAVNVAAYGWTFVLEI